MVSLSVFVIHFAAAGGWMEFFTGLCTSLSVTPGGCCDIDKVISTTREIHASVAQPLLHIGSGTHRSGSSVEFEEMGIVETNRLTPVT